MVLVFRLLNNMNSGLLRYEFPVLERTRMFLRLSYLFEQMEWLAAQSDNRFHQAALLNYFSIQDATQRGDQKTDVIQELERYKANLSTLVGNDEVDQTSLKETLDRIHQSIREINSIGIRLSHLSGQSELLRAMSQRSAIPAGFCEFDIPSYHHWLHLPDERRRQDLAQWIAPMKAYHRAIDLILEILRGTGKQMDNLLARDRGFECPTQGKAFSLVQVYIDPKYGLVPKVSANKYLLSVRFTPAGFGAQEEPPRDIPFNLGIC